MLIGDWWVQRLMDESRSQAGGASLMKSVAVDGQDLLVLRGCGGGGGGGEDPAHVTPFTAFR